MRTTATKAVSIKIDHQRLVGHLQNFFATSYTFIGELMQNARRAGATEIRFTFDREADAIEVCDNGGGVEDMQNLLTLAQSGWSGTVKAADKPFGMGFFAAIFAARGCVVDSRLQRLEFERDKLVAGEEAVVVYSLHNDGTRIRLEGFNEDFSFEEAQRKISWYSSGFPIDVYVNGARQARPCARENLPGVDTEIGFMSLPRVHREAAGRRYSYSAGMPRFFLQGLPIGRSAAAYSIPSATYNGPLVHLDGAKVEPKLPDRDTLVDEDRVCQKVDEIARGETRRWIEARKRVLSPVQFAACHFEDCLSEGLRHLLADVPVPARYLKEFNPDAADTSEYQFFTETDLVSGFLSLDDVQQGRVRVATIGGLDYDAVSGYCGAARAIFARELGWPLVSERLPSESWLWDHVIELEEAEIELEVEGERKGRFSGESPSFDVRLVKSARLKCAELDTSVYLSGPTALPAEGALVVIEGASSSEIRDAMLLLDAYNSDNSPDCPDYEMLDRDLGKLDDLVDALTGASPENLMDRVLQKGGLGALPLEGVFTVRVSKRDGSEHREWEVEYAKEGAVGP